jgi:hypothetical protein
MSRLDPLIRNDDEMNACTMILASDVRPLPDLDSYGSPGGYRSSSTPSPRATIHHEPPGPSKYEERLHDTTRQG